MNATTIHRGFLGFMIGKSPKFSRFNCEPFQFPYTLNLAESKMPNERHFMEFLLRNDWVQRIIGIKMDTSDGFFPDIRGEIYDGSGDRIDVELEYRAENYARHEHPYKGCDLILSFLKSPDIRFIRGIPVWSFYEGIHRDKYVRLCLFEDINYDFCNHEDSEKTEYQALSMIERRLYNLGGNYLKDYQDKHKEEKPGEIDW